MGNSNWFNILRKIRSPFEEKPVLSMALNELFEKGVKHPIMQPIDGNEPMIGCLVLFE